MKTKAGLHGTMIGAMLLATVGIALACVGCGKGQNNIGWVHMEGSQNKSTTTDSHDTIGGTNTNKVNQ